MFTLLAIIGWVLAIGAIAMLVIYPTLNKEEKVEETENRFGEKRTIRTPASNPILLSFNRKKSLILLFVGIFLALNTQFLFYARPGHQYFIVAPTGAKYAIFTSGVKVVMPLSRIQEWQKFVDIKVVSEGEPDEGIEGIIRNGIPIRFIDQVTASVKISARMQLPTDEDSFVKLAEEFRHPLNLVNNTLVPTVREQVINTGYMFAAQDYISGSAADFRMTLDEQLKDGGYSVEKTEHYDTIWSEIQISGQRAIKEINTTYDVKKRTKGGVPVRNEHDITKNNIIVSQVIVDQVQLEDAFKKRLEAQRDISAQKRIEMEKIETAKAEQQRIVAEGERDKAAERVTQEKAQVATLISIETDKKKEVTKKELAKIALETAKLEAQALRVKKDAEAYANQRLVSAGLTPQEKAQIYKDTQIGVAKALAGPNGINMPQMYMGGQGGSGKNANDPLAQLLMMMMAQQSMDKIGKSVDGK
jgi:hypothetical protein